MSACPSSQHVIRANLPFPSLGPPCESLPAGSSASIGHRPNTGTSVGTPPPEALRIAPSKPPTESPSWSCPLGVAPSASPLDRPGGRRAVSVFRSDTDTRKGMPLPGPSLSVPGAAQAAPDESLRLHGAREICDQVSNLSLRPTYREVTACGGTFPDTVTYLHGFHTRISSDSSARRDHRAACALLVPARHRLQTLGMRNLL